MNALTHATARTLPVSGPLLQEKAKEVATMLHLDAFKASNGWLESFRRRHGIAFGKITPETGKKCSNGTQQPEGEEHALRNRELNEACDNVLEISLVDLSKVDSQLESTNNLLQLTSYCDGSDDDDAESQEPELKNLHEVKLALAKIRDYMVGKGYRKLLDKCVALEEAVQAYTNYRT